MIPTSYTPELLAPAGSWDCARAAVANGADAIFFGLPRFNARLRADNFTETDLPELMQFLHKHGVKGYCAFNTLIFTSELDDAAAQLQQLEAAGVDAVIVQDIGLALMTKALAPRLHLHASTQMTITSPEGLRFARTLDLDLAVLSRELSLRELERFHKSGNDLPLEVFVHGALCVAYSGQCLTSESLGRRSANRGECAQACRMPYEMLVDGEKRDLGDKRYLLSPQDLAAVEEIPRLMELGVRSFKIEGRLKSPEYVAAVTQVYRKAIDDALALYRQGEALSPQPIAPEAIYSLEMTFSRGLYPGWMHGVNHQELVGARFGKKRGAYLGEVAAVAKNKVKLTELRVPIKAGDGIVFENPSNTEKEQGGYVFLIQDDWLEFARHKVDTRHIPPGTRVYKTSDPALDKALRASFQGDLPVRKRHTLELTVTGSPGNALRLVTPEVSVTSQMPLQPALKHPLTQASIREPLGKLGGTAYLLGQIDWQVEGEVMLPVSELNRMRRELVTQLDQLPEASPSAPLASSGVSPQLPQIPQITPEQRLTYSREAAVLHVLCRDIGQIDTALAAGVPRIYVDFEDIRRYAEAVQRVRDHHSDSEIYLATPRIQKAGEEGFFKLIERANPHGVLIRNLGAIEYFSQSGLPMTGDFSLNVANPLTANFFRQAGLAQLTISYDLNLDQVMDLLQGSPPEWYEITLHQHMPMFHMEHCAFAAFLSTGTSFLNCGRPCEQHQVKLRDRVGMEHPLKADVGCRNTLFNAVPQTGARFFDRLRRAGLRHYRVELLEESPAEAARILELYQQLLAGQRGGGEMWTELKAQSQLGVVTHGTMRGGS